MMLTAQYHRIVLILLAFTICLASAAPTLIASNQEAHPSQQVVFQPSASSSLLHSSIPDAPLKPVFEGPSMLKQVITAPKVVFSIIQAYSGLSSSPRLTNQYTARLRSHRRLPRPHP